MEGGCGATLLPIFGGPIAGSRSQALRSPGLGFGGPEVIGAFALLVSLAAQSPVRVACVGGSTTAGVGTKDPATQGYPAQLRRLLGSHYEVRSFGRSGATLSREGDLPYWGVAEFQAAQQYAPQIVV